MSSDFLRYAAASVLAVSTLGACSPEPIVPAADLPDVPEKGIEAGEEHVFVGIMIDSVAEVSEIDTVQTNASQKLIRANP